MKMLYEKDAKPDLIKGKKVAIFGFGGPIASSGSPKLVATWFNDSKRG